MKTKLQTKKIKGNPFNPPSFLDTAGVAKKISDFRRGEMIGTTRTRVNFFMNKFTKMGFIEYNGKIRVNKSLLTVVLHE